MADEKTFVERILEIQTKLKAPKNQWNKFGKYNYRSAEDILEAVKPLNKKYGCLLALNDAVELIGTRYYIKATATLYDAYSDNSVSISAYAREPEKQGGMSESQITGSASSYARKYALSGLYNIDDGVDADSVQTPPEPARKPTRKRDISNDVTNSGVTVDDINRMLEDAHKKGYKYDDMIKVARAVTNRQIEKFTELSAPEFNDVCVMLAGALDKTKTNVRNAG